MSIRTGAGYRLNPAFSLHTDGAQACLYAADRVSGSVLRGVPARMVEQLWEHAGRHGQIDGEVFADHPLGVPEHRWTAFVEQLARRGVLEPVDRAPAAAALPDPVTSVRVEAPDRLAAATERALAGCAVAVEVSRLVRSGGPHELVVLVDDRYHVARHRELNRQAALTGAAFLSVRVLPGGHEIGPLVLPGSGACFECYWQRLQAPFVEDGPPSWVADREPRGCFRPPGRLGELVVGGALHALAVEVHSVLHGPVPATLSAALTADLARQRTEVRRILEVPGCGHCALAVGAA
jgi:bacteriocin biosynthesis cyclodehydratase domain-containing protein